MKKVGLIGGVKGNISDLLSYELRGESAPLPTYDKPTYDKFRICKDCYECDKCWDPFVKVTDNNYLELEFIGKNDTTKNYDYPTCSKNTNIKNIDKLYDTQEKICIERNGNKIYLTDEEVDKIIEKGFTNLYLDWAIELLSSNENILKNMNFYIIKEKIKKVAKNTYEAAHLKDYSLTLEEEYETFTQEFYKELNCKESKEEQKCL